MLSPGRFHERVPRERAANLRFRRKVLAAARSDPRMQRALLEACARDFFFWVDVFAWQYNPRADAEVGPFVTWDFQRAAARAVIERLFRVRRSMVWEKSRELGATWLALLLILWVCLFHGWKKFLLVSHTEDAVNADDMDSLFGKLQFVLDRLPGWMARGATKTKKGGFKFPATGSAVTGAATTERAGVGGRATMILLDEFSKQKDDRKIYSQTADTGPRLFVGTHYGVGGCFYDLTRPDSGLPKIVMHWSEHPDKRKGLYKYDPESPDAGPDGIVRFDPTYEYPPEYPFDTSGAPAGGPYPGVRSPWYDAECEERKSPRDVAMHLDIDPSGSGHQFFDAGTVRTLAREFARDPLWQGDLVFDRARARPLQLVAREGGPLRLWVVPDARHKVRPARYAVGGDIATGTGATPSVLAVGDADRGELVGEYANPHIDPVALAPLAVALCWLFQDAEGGGAVLCWECPGPGMKFGQEVVDEYGYGNVYYRTDVFDRRAVRSNKPGWWNTPKEFRLLMEDIRGALYDRKLIVPSREMLEETLSFEYGPRGDVYHPGAIATNDPTGARENHGDRPVAGALMWKMMAGLGVMPAAEERPETVDPYSFLGRRLARQQREREQGAWS
jgi:hypothetical protein